MSKKVKRVCYLWGRVLDITGGEGEAHKQYRQFMIERGAALDVSFKDMTDGQAEHDAAIIEEYLKSQLPE